MIPSVCLICGEESNRLQNIRDHSSEGSCILKYPQILDIPENEPVMICDVCINLNSESIESIEVSKNSSGSQRNNSSIDLQTLDENLDDIVENPRIRTAIRDLLKKPMPAKMKKRKIQEMLPAESQSVLRDINSQRSQQTIEDSSINNPEPSVADLLQPLITEPPRKRTRLARASDNNKNNESNSSLSSDSNASINNTLQNMQISRQIESAIPPSPEINAPFQQIVITRENNSSVENIQHRTRRSNSNNSQMSNRSNSSRATRSDDGNAHSNVAAPRRIKVTRNPRPLSALKNTGG